MSKITLKISFFIIIALFFVGSARALGLKEDPLRKADSLIAEQKYDEAIVYLSEFIKLYPDRFDVAQAKLRRITQIRASYNKYATILIDTLQSDPTNQEKKLAMIKELEALERIPNPAIQDFVSKTKDLALFTYNKAKMDGIFAEGRALIDGGQYSTAIERYESGFDLYRPEFAESGFSDTVIMEANERVDRVSLLTNDFNRLDSELEKAFAELAASYPVLVNLTSESNAKLDAAWSKAANSAMAFVNIRRAVVEEGISLEKLYLELSNNNPDITENSFIPFAYRFILGRKTEAQVEGITGSFDASWTRSLGQAQAALDKVLDGLLSDSIASFESSSWNKAQNGFNAVILCAERGMSLLSLWANYIPSELLERSTKLGQAVLAVKGEDYLRYKHAALAAKAYSELAATRNSLASEELVLAGIEPQKEDPAKVLASYEAERLAFLQRHGELDGIRTESGKNAETMASWAKAGYVSSKSQYMQANLDAQISNSIELAKSLEIKAVALSYAYQYGSLEKSAELAKGEQEKAVNYINGLPSEDPLFPDAVYLYPGKALEVLKSVDSVLAGIKKDIAAILVSVQGREQYIASDSSVKAWIEKVLALSAATEQFSRDTASLGNRANELRKLAESNKLEADRRLAESKTALKANDFERARERLERAREKYSASLVYELNQGLKNESDRMLDELASSILRAENELVVTETRRLVNSGKSEYMQGNFDRAEMVLLQARSRWSTTNSSPEVEVEYWLKLVQTALYVKTGRDIPVSAPLFPEMSQLLSLAKQYYEEGAQALAKKDKPGATKAFSLAKQKISEVKIAFPLNQEARVLELRINQLSDPDEFAKSFTRMYNDAVKKIESKLDLSTAYSDLKDLEAINPRYPGLKAQIEKAEILLGFRQLPPDPKAIAEARSLVQAAQRIFDSRQLAQFSFAKAQLDRAISLDPNNEAAGLLKDKIASYIGGDTTIVLPTAAESLYNEAVAFFTNGDYINARARLSRLEVIYAKGFSMQKVADLDTRLKARGY